jgi:hypothetical protein
MKWSVPDGIPLHPGVNVITVTACDSGGITTTDIITVVHTPSRTEVRWTAVDIPLQPGINEITVTAHNEAGQSATDVLTATFTPVPPRLAITIPVAAPVYETDATSMPLAGMAIGELPVTSVTWENDRGGSGDAILE